MKVLSSHTTHAALAPSTVFARWSDPATWPTWDPEVKSVVFESPATLGKSGRLQPASGPALRFSITGLRIDRELTNTGTLPGARLEFEHLVEPADDGSVVTVTVRVSGLLSPVWARILAPSMFTAARSSVVGLLSYLDAA